MSTTNVFFNNFDNFNEQMLIDSLVEESIKIYGIENVYIVRTLGAEDRLLNEDDLPTFSHAFNIEMYIKNVDSFEGEGDFLSKFGLQIRDQITFTISVRSFERFVRRPTGLYRPREGDLVYFSLNNKAYKIMHVEHEAIFYQMGSLQTYDLKCELFEYSNETFSTGNEQIDSLFTNQETDQVLTDEALETIDPISRNKTIQDEADAILDFSDDDPFALGGKW